MTSSSRDRILARLAAVRRGNDDRAAIDSYIAACARGPIPPMGTDLIDIFCKEASALANDIERVASLAQVPGVVARYLDSKSVERRAVCWPAFMSLAWKDQGIAIESRIARGDDVVGITGAFAAIAETGTLMMLSGAQTPASVSLVPETHVAIVSTDRFVATMEDGWSRMRSENGGAPRAVNFISGPSRTGDVEQTSTLGAHGPRRVLIVLVDA
jgi:L-lactate dehydrogenase complex protein LldG